MWWLWLAGCATTPVDIAADEQLALDDLWGQPIAVVATVHDAGGNPLVAQVQIGDDTATTDVRGSLKLTLPTRQNRRIRVDAPGYRHAFRTAWLAQPADVNEVDIGVIHLQPASDATRFVFTGDAMLGRRFLDVSGETPPDEPYPATEGAVIDASDPYPDAMAVLRGFAPELTAPDVGVTNLESPVLVDPSTPHPDKEFVFYSPPAIADALADSGVDYVSLGNNHTYDYLDQGVIDTTTAVTDAGLLFSGVGVTEESAWRPSAIGGFDLHSATSIDGSNTSVLYVATDTKGGAANARDADQVTDAIAGSIARGQVPIMQLHVGVEYAAGPSSTVDAYVQTALDAGAPLVVGHHPHTIQGFAGDADTLVAYSLGNFLFDSQRAQTFAGALLQVDMVDTWEAAEIGPVYIEDYAPQPPAGPFADRVLRSLAAKSPSLVVTHESGRAGLHLAGEAIDRVVQVPVTVQDDRIGVLDLTEVLAPGESVQSAFLDEPLARATPGTDLLWFGDFEDIDLDGDFVELSHWNHDPGSVFPCTTRARSGIGALCSTRTYTDLDPSLMSYRHRIRVLGDAEADPRKRLTLLGWTQGENAGPVSIALGVYNSVGTDELDRQTVVELPAGDWGWTRFTADFTLPEDTATDQPRGTRIFFTHDIPQQRGAPGVFAVDDVKLINWLAVPELIDREFAFAAPNDFDALRIEASPGEKLVTLTLRRWVTTE